MSRLSWKAKLEGTSCPMKGIPPNNMKDPVPKALGTGSFA